MGNAEEATTGNAHLATRFRDWFADHLGVDQERKTALYVDLSGAVSLRDATYWLQILFAAGIATLGLVLNSPAVIIGAMLISPLMGPILTGGLALATGDVILGLRSIVTLALSCLVAVGFAVVLVGLLPFKEMTGEIAARTRPTTLDLIVAFFSGAVGSIATCKQVKGIVTSIPGVAIAVALMPPLCVVGYGIGFAFSANGAEGMRVARGGGLLFLTNLVAITFTAMLVFLALHIDTASVRERIEEWRAEDRESSWFRSILKRLHTSGAIRSIGSLPGRMLLIAVPILVILIPLAQSFNQLKVEITRQQSENRIRRAATSLWERNFAKLTDGQQRSFIDQLLVTQEDGKINLQLRVFTNKPFSGAERTEYARAVAAGLNRSPDAVAVQFVEVPTTSGELLAKAKEERHVESPPSISQLEASFVDSVESALRGVRFPPRVRMIDCHVTTALAEPLHIGVSYLGDADIEQDAKSLITDDIRSRLSYPTAQVSLDRIEESFGTVTFGRNQAAVAAAAASLLDRAAQVLQQHPRLILNVITGSDKSEREGLADERTRNIRDYLLSQLQLPEDRIAVESGPESTRDTILRLEVSGEGK
ncbi:MAG TPA: DUF389 domain-containing protein [Blastocatellia bacterium]|nr:DUF389 domain-containing protein [Blastocatellia bacterium]